MSPVCATCLTNQRTMGLQQPKRGNTERHTDPAEGTGPGPPLMLPPRVLPAHASSLHTPRPIGTSVKSAAQRRRQQRPRQAHRGSYPASADAQEASSRLTSLVGVGGVPGHTFQSHRFCFALAATVGAKSSRSGS